MLDRKTFGRRQFLKGTIGTASGFIGFPWIVPSFVFGDSAPSNKIVIGAIGVGSRGRWQLDSFLRKNEVRVIAVCDVDTKHLDQSKQKVDRHYSNNDCRRYIDYRELIERGDIDAVLQAVPDHWHGIISVDCARAGLDIYGQVPLARTIYEGQAICKAVKRYGRIWQTGSWQRSTTQFHQACELVRNGRIGKVTYVEVGFPCGVAGLLHPKASVPETLNWNMWLGPAPWREYAWFGKNGIHGNWKWMLDYSGGELTQWAGHHIDIAHWGLGLDRTGPVEIHGRAQYPSEGFYDAPHIYKFTARYADGVQMVINSRLGLNRLGICWHGEQGQWIYVNRDVITASSENILKDAIRPNEIQLYKSTDHQQNFIDCVKNRRETVAPAEVAHRSISVALLGEIAMLTQRKLKWDPNKEQFEDDNEANKLLSRPFRRPWHL
jgi:predicted dehydrogenase